MNQIRPQKSRLLPALAGLALTLNNSANAEVIVYFEQDGPDVTASWTGRLDRGNLGSLSTSIVSSEGSYKVSGPDRLYQIEEDKNFPFYVGIPTLTPLSPFLLTVQRVQAEQLVSFGFSRELLFLPSVGESEPPDFRGFDFDPSVHLIRFFGQTLSGMGAENLDNTLAWTSSTGDTIRYTTGPVPVQTAVPEPSSALLGFLILGTPCLLSRRR